MMFGYISMAASALNRASVALVSCVALLDRSIERRNSVATDTGSVETCRRERERFVCSCQSWSHRRGVGGDPWSDVAPHRPCAGGGPDSPLPRNTAEPCKPPTDPVSVEAMTGCYGKPPI